MIPDFCRDETIAGLLDLPVSTFRTYVERGIIPAGLKIGKHRLWNRLEVYKTLDNLTQNPNSNAFTDAVKRAANGTLQNYAQRR